MYERHSRTADAPHGPASDPPRRPRHSGWVRWPVAWAAILVASCQQTGILDPQGPVASAELLLLLNSTAIMLVVVVPVILATLGFAWWYRASNPRASRSTDEGYEGRTEFVTWSIPVLIVILLGGVIWIGSHQLDPRAPLPGKADPLRVEVVALDWKWLFIYPDQGIAAVNQLVMPVGTPVEFRLTSATVMNSLFIPQLGSQIYTMGGMTTHLNLMADKPGEFPGFSAMFSGDGFSDMRFTAKAVPAVDFDAWVAQVRGAGSALDDAAYAELAKPSIAAPPATYRSVEPKLFDRIIEQTVSGSPSLPLPRNAGAGRVGAGAARAPAVQQTGG
jgi:cytochrome o ubiquinol oxidase subunit II